MKLTATPLLLIVLSTAAVGPAAGQGFGSQQVITTAAAGASCVFALDLDGDGDLDVLSASRGDNKIAWYENLGSGVFGVQFGPQQVIGTPAAGARCVFATDLDGDGDADVLSASSVDNKIAWYENLGGGLFGPPRFISLLAYGAASASAADLDGDGDFDALSASANDDKVAWYENQSGGSTSQHEVSTSAGGASSVLAVDVDGDGDLDVLSACYYDDKIAWYENQGGATFGVQFGLEQVISATAVGALSIHATDLDWDGDVDVLSASSGDGKVAWYENEGAGVFGPQQVIGTADGAASVYTADLDGDGDADVLSASIYDNRISWYENLATPPDCNANGIPDSEDLTNLTSLDCNGNLIPDE